MKLNLGSGTDYRKGYVNVDSNKVVKADKYFDLNKLPYPIKDNSVSEIYCSHIIEHLTISPPEFLLECHRILKRKGELRLIFPNVHWYRTRLNFLTGSMLWRKHYSRYHLNQMIKPSWVYQCARMIGFNVHVKETKGITGLLFFFSTDLRNETADVILTKPEGN